MRKFTVLGMVIVFILMITITGCGPGEKEPGQETKSPEKTEAIVGGLPETIKIGVNQSVTGAVAGTSALEIEGIQLANKVRPTLSTGQKIELVLVDNKSDKIECATVATKLIDQDKVAITLGCCTSGMTLAAGAVGKDKGHPMITASSSSPLVTEGNEWYFRLCFIDPYQGAAMAKYAYETLGYRKVSMLRELNNDCCVGTVAAFTEHFTRYTGDPDSVKVANFNQGDQDFSSQITSLMQLDPDAIYLPSPSNIGDIPVILRQFRQLGHDVPIMGTDGYEVPEVIEIGGKDVEGIIYTTAFDTGVDLTPAGVDFFKLYADEAGGRQPAYFTVLAFDAYNIALDAIEKAGSIEPEAIRQALKSMQEWDGAGGYVTFDELNNPNKPAVIKIIKDGEFQYVDTVRVDEENK